jgi:hypothetical protein
LVAGALWFGGCDCYSSVPPDDPGEISEGDDDDDDVLPRDDDSGPPDPSRDAGSGSTDGGGLGAGEPAQLDDEISYHPRAAIDASGNATVVWARESGVVARRWESGAWSEIEMLGSGDDPRIDFNGAGEGVAIWRDHGGRATAARLFAPGSGWLPQESIGPGGNAVTGAVAIDGAGRVVALFDWGYADTDRLKTVRHDPASGWGVASVIEDGQFLTRMADVAANDAGDFAGVWTDLGDGGETVWASREVDGWQTPAQVGGQDGVFDPDVTVDGAGDSLVAWGNNDDEVFSVMASWQPAGGEYGEPEVVGPADGGLWLSASTSFDGISFVAWISGSDVSVARRDPVVGWQPAEVIDGLGATHIGVAADDAGGAIVAWGRRRVFWSRYAARTGWTVPTQANPAAAGDALQVSVDAAPDGTAVIAWDSFDRDGYHVWGLVLPP